MDPVAQPPREPRPRWRRGRPHRRLPVAARAAAAAAREGRAAAPRAPPGRRTRSAPAVVRRFARPARLGAGVRAGLDQRVRAGEEALDAAPRWRARLAVRASSRPKKISTSGRATCVERTRSVGSWKVPTFSERECRRASDDALGAKGSWTWTMSSRRRRADPRASGEVQRDRSRPRPRAHGAAASGRPRAPAGHRRRAPFGAVEQRRRAAGARVDRAGATRARPRASRTALRRRPDGRVRRVAADTRSTNSLTSLCAPTAAGSPGRSTAAPGHAV